MPISEGEKLEKSRHEELLSVLLGAGGSGLELPGITDLVLALIALAEGKRRKAILPLASSTGEYALVRRGHEVLLSYYDSGPVPQLFVRDRRLDLCSVLAMAGRALTEQAEHALTNDRSTFQIAERALRTRLQPEESLAERGVTRSGGSASSQNLKPIAYGFNAKLWQSEAHEPELGIRADVHALLFEGELWAVVHGRRLGLVKGPIFPAIARMISAARSVVEAWEAERPLTLKLRAGEFGIGVRMSRAAQLALTLLGPTSEPVTLPNLDVPTALAPMLALAADLVRVVIATDRAQAKNLRLTSLRDEVRALRRVLRRKAPQESFMNREPELLRASCLPQALREPQMAAPARNQDAQGRLRLSLRWRAEVEGLNTGSAYLCGDRIVIATPSTQLALSRDDGQPLWIKQRNISASLIAGTSLVCVGAEGNLELCDVADGETYARGRISLRAGGSFVGMFAGGRGAPPVVVLSEGRDRLIAIDTRTGEPRWRFRSSGRGGFRFARAGRILLVVTGDNTLDALDVASGEVVWRWSDPGRLTLAPAVVRDRAVAIAGQPGSTNAAILCFDLFSGQLVFRNELACTPLRSPTTAEHCAIVPGLLASGPILTAYDLTHGRPRWQRDDVGLGDDGSALVVDQRLIVNSARGVLSGVDLGSGELVWQHQLADAARDALPRRLEPVLRGGALFVPSTQVNVIRPIDGALLGAPLAECVIPDFLRVDERGWLYLAEESGHLEAYAPAPHLRLVKG